MSRQLAAAAGVLVATGVFTWLAGPLLETQFGTEALLATYAGLASACGALTYVVVCRLAGWHPATAPASDADENGDGVTVALDDAVVDEEVVGSTDGSFRLEPVM